jgi:hypothetical protein
VFRRVHARSALMFTVLELNSHAEIYIWWVKLAVLYFNHLLDVPLVVKLQNVFPPLLGE